MVFTSCEKEESQVLSDFIVGGEWVYEQIEATQTITFSGQFLSDGTYDLEVTNGDITLLFNGGYSIDDVTNTLTIDEPDIEQDGETGVAVFDVAWLEGVEQMVWTQIGGDEPNVMTWTR